jgi:PHP family Zn ribbon phosphoesterase
VLVWREDKKWIESFKLLDIEDETCKIVLSSESTDFRSTVIKSFLIESINDVESIDENIQSISDDVQSSDHQNNSSAEFFEIIRSLAIINSFAIIDSFAITRSTRTRRLSLRYQNFADIIVFLQDDEISNQFEETLSFISSLTFIFENSRRKKINDLLEKRVFELITINVVLRDVRIFNFKFVDEIKHLDTTETYEKSRLVIQIYNDHDKTLMLI